MSATSDIDIDRVVGAGSTGALREEKYASLIRRLLTPPGPTLWLETLRYWFLVGGVLLLLSGLIFFGAYNWEALGRLQKLGLLQAILVGVFSGVMLRGLKSPEGKVLLVAAGLIVGGLLAVMGQVYQTGADSYLLFLCWALLILPWCFAGPLNILWLLQLVLVDVTFTLWWYQQVGDDFHLYSQGFLLLNLVLAVFWETARGRYDWIDVRPAELLLFSGLVPVSLSACAFFLDLGEGGLSLPMTGVVLAALYKLRGRRLLTMVTVASSLFCLATTLAGRVLLETMDTAGMLFLGVFIMIEIALIVRWLTPLHRKTNKPAPPDNASSEDSHSFEELTEEEQVALRAAGEFPWYVQALIGFAAWTASLFVLLFFLLTVWNDEAGLCVFGAILYGGSLWFSRNRKPPFFLRHSLLSVHITGVLVAAAGVSEFDDNVFAGALVASVLLLISARYYDEVLGGFLFGLGFVISGMLAAGDLMDEVGGTVWLLVLMLLLHTCSGRLIPLLESSIKRQTLPVLRGLAAGLLLTSLTLDLGRWNQTVIPVLAVGATAFALWQSHRLRHPGLAKLGLLVVGALTNSVPAFAISIFVYLVGFQTRQRFVRGLALASMVVSGTFFYYSLDLMLITKSLVLLGSGAVLLVCRVLMGVTQGDPEEKLHAL